METTTLGRREFKGIDLTKFALALLVVAGHTHPFIHVRHKAFLQFWESALLVVVPYFFIAAGFFLFQKVYQTPYRATQLATIWPYIKRIAKLYLYWTIIFLPITLWNYFTDDIIFRKDMVLFVRGTLFFGENYYSWPLWFLLSMTYSLATIYLLLRLQFRWSSIFLMSIVFFLVATIFNQLVKQESENQLLLLVGRIVKYLFLTGRLFTGMFYLMIGGLIARNQLKLPVAAIPVLLLVALFFQFYPIRILSPLLFCIFPIVLFYLTLQLQLPWVSNHTFYRKCSTVLYFTHMIFFFLYSILFREVAYFGWDAFLVSALVPILLTPLIIRYENRVPILKALFGG